MAEQASAMGEVVTPDFWRGRHVLLTGHTGFKGAWLTLLLHRMGAKVAGYALAPHTSPNLHDLLKFGAAIDSTIADIGDRERLAAALAHSDPEIIFHLAGQSLVSAGYTDPIGTYATNAMGTAHLLEAARRLERLRAIVIVTSDKCYAPLEGTHSAGLSEDDRLGGADPYSGSKACAELIADTFRTSFLAPAGIGLASARAGNVIGGGDWAEDRLIPDAMRALTANEPLRLRRPDAVRPWQHVLEPLIGYAMLAERLHAGASGFDRGWNFGPATGDSATVMDLAQRMAAFDPALKIETERQRGFAETQVLQLDSSLARHALGWRSHLGLDAAVRLTAQWYHAHRAGQDMHAYTLAQIDAYLALARNDAGNAA